MISVAPDAIGSSVTCCWKKRSALHRCTTSPSRASTTSARWEVGKVTPSSASDVFVSSIVHVCGPAGTRDSPTSSTSSDSPARSGAGASASAVVAVRSGCVVGAASPASSPGSSSPQAVNASVARSAASAAALTPVAPARRHRSCAASPRRPCARRSGRCWPRARHRRGLRSHPRPGGRGCPPRRTR